MIPIPSVVEVSNKETLWKCAEAELRRIISEEEVENQFRMVQVLSVNNGTVKVGVPSAERKRYINENYQSLLTEIFSSLLQRKIALQVQEHEIPERSNGVSQHVVERETPNLVVTKPQKLKFTQTPLQLDPLNENYTFETFVIGSSNKMANAAAEAVAESPAESYNPLFVYGGVGLGKTHLMQAIGNAVLKKQPNKTVAYLSAEQFVNMFIDAIKRNERLTFQALFRNVDVLLIDDIQFLAGKESTQEEFFHTFNALHNRKKQIVISSDRPPKDIPTIEDRLRSRFEWGLIVDIGPPDIELRMAILRKKCENIKIEIDDEVIEFVAKKISTSIRELEGALQKVIAHATFSHEAINAEMAKEVLGELYDREVKEISIEKIQRKVAEAFNIKPSDIIGKNRSRSIALPRQVAMYLSRTLTRHSFPEIGTFFGNKDHTTVLFACNKIQKEIEQDPKLRSKIQQLADSFNSQ